MGRPSDYTEETAERICALIAEGESLRHICLTDGMPDKSTVLRWLRVHEKFRDQYAQAREHQVEAFADEILDIAEDGTNDWIERENRKGETYIALNSEAIDRSRIRIDARKWLMGKLKPKKYGDKLDVKHDGNLTIEVLRFADKDS